MFMINRYKHPLCIRTQSQGYNEISELRRLLKKKKKITLPEEFVFSWFEKF